MPATFDNLKLNRIIVHEVLLASDLEGERKPSYSDEFLELDPKGAQLMNKRLTDSLGSESHSVELNVELDDEGSSFDIVTQLLDAGDNEFTRLSKDLAARLTNAQNTGTIKAGIALVVDGTMGSNARPTRFVAVLKAESDSAFIKEKTAKGLLLKFIADMVLGAQQRLYKIGCFVELKRRAPGDGDGVRSKDDFEVIVYDHQMSNTGDNNAARYFYGTFLGCRLADSAPRLTRIFYEQTSEFINGLNVTAEKRIEARQHLVSYLKSQDKHFSVKEFAERYLPKDLRDVFFQRFKKIQFPARNVTKDIAPIRRRLQVRRLMFTSKVRISAPEEGFHELVKVVEENTEFTTVQIAGSLEAQV
jgi:nucleoid-associated protein YejK